MKRLILAASVLGLVGCASQKAAVVASPEEPSKVAVAPAKVAPAPVAAVDQKQQDLDALLKGLVIHFGFDAADLTPESRGRLDALADALRANSKAQIRIAGNCDELGTVEYNLALGQKRADAVAADLGLGQPVDLIPALADPKDLYSLLAAASPQLRAA